MTAPKIIVVAGANGQLGRLLVQSLQDRAARQGQPVQVRALVRPGRALPPPSETLTWLAVDYADQSALDRACDGAFAVVSTLLGVEDVVIGTQSRLLAAALKTGARRFIPSDYAGDFTRLPQGTNRNFDWRSRFHRIAARMIADSGRQIDFTSIYQGGFTELLASGWALFDYKKRRIAYFGSPDAALDFTTYADTAAYTAAVALDDRATPAGLRISGVRLTPRKASDLARRVTGTEYPLKRIMPVAMLRLVIALLRTFNPAKSDPMPIWVGMQYGLAGALGLMAPDHLDNDRYPDLTWTGPEETIARAHAAQAKA